MTEQSNWNSKRQAQDEEFRVGWKMAGIGMTVASEVAAGVLLGWLFDLWRGTGTTGVAVGAIVGILVATWSLIRGTLKLNRQLDRTAPLKGRGTPLPAKDDDRETENDEDDDRWNDQHDR